MINNNNNLNTSLPLPLYQSLLSSLHLQILYNVKNNYSKITKDALIKLLSPQSRGCNIIDYGKNLKLSSNIKGDYKDYKVYLIIKEVNSTTAKAVLVWCLWVTLSNWTETLSALHSRFPLKNRDKNKSHRKDIELRFLCYIRGVRSKSCTTKYEQLVYSPCSVLSMLVLYSVHASSIGVLIFGYYLAVTKEQQSPRFLYKNTHLCSTALKYSSLSKSRSYSTSNSSGPRSQDFSKVSNKLGIRLSNLKSIYNSSSPIFKELLEILNNDPLNMTRLRSRSTT
jgi:hypothetical protein